MRIDTDNVSKFLQRSKIIFVPYRTMKEILEDYSKQIKSKFNLPKDTIITCAWIDAPRAGFRFQICSNDFQLVDDGAELPEIHFKGGKKS